ncbi:hypothetical protein ACFV9C_23675 [Kribbella sp. NPDC059898]|uniref:hypothetical protein n=1 Tax=Kribbella sp. NPDC059898 TaxID=3346995 RepID=UPI00365593D0
MSGEQIDTDELRRRFPWVGLASIDDPELSVRYREIQADARKDREIVEAIEAARRSA